VRAALWVARQAAEAAAPPAPATLTAHRRAAALNALDEDEEVLA